jgi:MoxR-like ATPase
MDSTGTARPLPPEAPSTPPPEPTPEDLQAVASLAEARDSIVRQIEKRVVGQHEVVEHLLVALFSRGHCLFVGVPGLAKTLLISTLAEVLNLSFNRIQFTPDLMPSDITGTDILEEDRATGRRAFRFLQGPLFANIILADEVNRTPPKTQAALLQAMQEYRITAGGRTYPLALPFLVFATQNPIEQEGTYPLPEAQLDRFMFLVDVGYPTADEEVEIVKSTTGATQRTLQRILSPEKILALQELVRRVPVPDHVVRFAVDLVRNTRPKEPGVPDFVQKNVAWGAGPRASQYLVVAAKARAILSGRFVATVEDVRALARPVLRHRVLPNFTAESEGITSVKLVDQLLALVKG